MSKQQEEMNKRFDEKFTESDGGRYLRIEPADIKSFLQSEIDLAVADREKEIVDMIGRTEPAPVLDVYLDKVKNGNKDDMYDYGVKITREMCVSLITKEN